MLYVLMYRQQVVFQDECKSLRRGIWLLQLVSEHVILFLPLKFKGFVEGHIRIHPLRPLFTHCISALNSRRIESVDLTHSNDILKVELGFNNICLAVTVQHSAESSAVGVDRNLVEERELLKCLSLMKQHFHFTKNNLGVWENLAPLNFQHVLWIFSGFLGVVASILYKIGIQCTMHNDTVLLI